MKQFRTGSAKLAAGVVGVLVAAQAFAFTPRQDEAVQKSEYRHPDVYVRQVHENIARLPGESATAALGRIGSPADAAYVDVRTGRWARLQPVQPLVPGRGVGNTLTWEALGRGEPKSDTELAAAAWDAFAGWLARHAEDLRIDPSEIVAPGRVTVFSPDHIHIWSPRRVAGLPVRDSSLTASIRYGNLVLFGVENWGDLDDVGFAELTAEQATLSLERHLVARPLGSTWKAAELVWVPVSTVDEPGLSTYRDGLGYRLAWALRHDLGVAGDRWESLVDARDGTLLAVIDTVQHGAATPRRVTGGVYPVSNDGTPPDGVEQLNWPMPFTNVTVAPNVYPADGGGNLPVCADGSISTALAGPFIRMQDQCGAINLSSTGDLNFGASGGTDCVTPGVGGAGNTHASRTGFFELNQIKQMAMSHLPTNFWLQSQLLSVMNITQTCNANWNGSNINFFRSGGGCANTGELAGIFDHEWGHGMDNNDAVPTVSNPGEGIADVYASLRLNDSCLGRNFRPGINCGGYGNPCTNCTGVRNIDWAERALNAPTTITWIGPACGSGGGAPCGGGVHCEGAVYSEAVWDLWNRDLTAAPYNYTLDRAREVATFMTFQGATAVGTWFSCTQGSGGCAATNGYPHYRVADDDDGNLNNGTPHSAAIYAAFNRHGIACAPVPTDGGCSGTPAAAPVVTAVARDRGSKLTWPAVPNATEYRVYRTDGVFDCAFGKTLLATTTDLQFIDSGLQNGREYSYVVIGTNGNDTCLGPASSCTQVTPAAGANLSVLVDDADFTTSTGDGDEFLDNCETAEVHVPMANIGTGALTNLRILSAQGPAGTVFTDSFPVVVSPSLASCANADAHLNFIAGGLTPAGTMSIEIEVAANEFGGDNRTYTIVLGPTEGDFQLFASRQYDFETDMEDWTTINGTFIRDTAGGGAGGSTAYVNSSEFLDGQCDIVRSPLMILAANSTMQFSTNMDIEEQSGQWWDRANVGIYNPGTGARTLVTPSAGRLYNASGIGGTCGTENQAGWAGRTFNSWATSDWSSAALQTGTFAGIPTAVQVNYGTDPAVFGYGIRFDRVTVTNAEWQVDDGQSDACSDTMPFFGDFEEGNFTEWSSVVP